MSEIGGGDGYRPTGGGGNWGEIKVNGTLIPPGYFTWEDVDALRDAENGSPEVLPDVGVLASLADRIAALLPPRETP